MIALVLSYEVLTYFSVFELVHSFVAVLGCCLIRDEGAGIGVMIMYPNLQLAIISFQSNC